MILAGGGRVLRQLLFPLGSLRVRDEFITSCSGKKTGGKLPPGNIRMSVGKEEEAEVQDGSSEVQQLQDSTCFLKLVATFG